MPKKIYQMEADQRASTAIDDIMKRDGDIGFAELCKRAFALYNAHISARAHGLKTVIGGEEVVEPWKETGG